MGDPDHNTALLFFPTGGKDEEMIAFGHEEREREAGKLDGNIVSGCFGVRDWVFTRQIGGIKAVSI